MRSRPRPVGRGALLLCAGLAVAGATPPADPFDAELAALGLDPERIVRPAALTDAMRSWARERIPERGSDEERLQELVRALVSPDGLGVVYDARSTGTAEEVFTARRGNCLSFTHLLIALARAIGIDAYYLEVQREPSFRQEGDLVVVWEHVTAGFGPASKRLVLEFSLGPPGIRVATRRLPELTALAMHYSNRGAELLRSGQRLDALGWLETAVRLDPSWSHAWLNLGVARRRTGDVDGAEAAYRRAITADPDHLQAYHNLAGLLRLRGEKAAAREILDLLDREDSRDPYIHLALGDADLDDGLAAEARRYYRRARRLAPAAAEPRAALGLAAMALDRPARARRWLRRAEAGEDPGPRLSRLRQTLAESLSREDASG